MNACALCVWIFVYVYTRTRAHTDKTVYVKGSGRGEDRGGV
jgi:hypothetical protein